MKAEEIALIESKHNAAIIAPAGHGKTEMISELVDKLPGKKLVLTHTNAGVSVLSKRLDRKHVGKEKYSLSTISSFCMKWCEAYPVTANIDLGISVIDDNFFSDRIRGSKGIFSHKWARNVIFSTYSCVIVDEYQDCNIEQHQIFLELNKTIPIYVLGDPLQSIFGWSGKPVSWKNIEFEIVDIYTEPYRWKNSNIELGKYLTKVRKTLMPSLDGKCVRFDIVPNGDFIKVISPSDVQGAKLLNETRGYKSVLYITKWQKEQCAFSQNMGGIFQNDEPQNLKDLYYIAKKLDNGNVITRTNAIISFMESCATHIASELVSYKKHIEKDDFNFGRISKHVEFGNRILKLHENNRYDEILSVLEWFNKNPDFKIYRFELFTELIRSIRFARDNGKSIYESAKTIRMMSGYQSKYSHFQRLSSRTVLSKGLEFECVVIDLKDSYTATDMYVAMTRAMKTIIFITDKSSILLEKPKGI